MITVVAPGLDTCVQDFPGRLGCYAFGFPPSGPLDSWSFRLANALVGNTTGAAALECQYIGPTLRFQEDCLIAITGADMSPELDGHPVASWQRIAVRKGQTLAMSYARYGARAYLAFCGGIDVPEFMGSRSTFKKAGVGGLNGSCLVEGQTFSLNGSRAVDDAPVTIPEDRRPHIPSDNHWEIEVVAGPNDDWIAEESIKQFIETDWKLSSKNDRTGFRLEGPDWTFTDKAHNKPPEHGEYPSNVIDYGYPIGGINLGGQTPIILVNDAITMGGFICPFTVPECAFWKLGQSVPGSVYQFQLVSVEEAQRLSDKLSALIAGAM